MEVADCMVEDLGYEKPAFTITDNNIRSNLSLRQIFDIT